MASVLGISPGRLQPPKAAAAAGIIFSILLIVSLTILRIAAPAGTGPDVWLSDPSKRTALRFALQIVPFAGIAFLWFMGVLRNRLGSLEDQFFATVFFGSGLLFVASLFAATAIGGAFLAASDAGPIERSGHIIGGLAARAFMNIFAIKMAGVFMVSTCAIALRTSLLPRWLAYSGFACAIILLLVITNWQWIALLFPVWIMVVSIYVLISGRARFQSVQVQPGHPSS